MCNAVASGFVALESKEALAVTTWGLVRFMAACMQYHFVIKNKCNKFLSFDEMHGFATYPVVKEYSIGIDLFAYSVHCSNTICFYAICDVWSITSFGGFVPFTIFFGITAMVLIV